MKKPPNRTRKLRRKKSANGELSFTKKGPGRIHKYGDSPKLRSSTHDEQPGDRNNFISRPDSLDSKWKLSDLAIRERARRNDLNRLISGRKERYAKS